jgi:HAD superfamily hydrolase (TIGR01509 family)
VDPGLQAVIFDVDGTIADTERHGHRVAFNLAFEQLGLPHRWGEEEYGRLLETPGGEHRLRGYLTAQGLSEEEAGRLAKDLHRTKQALFLELMRRGAAPLRPGVDRLLDELAAAGVRLGVATTAGRAWVGELLATLLGPERAARFEAVVTGEDVARRKPDPEVYRIVLGRLGVDPASAVAIEDSQAGVAAATGAGLACLAVRNGYTRHHDLSLADLVVEDIGGPGVPATVVANPHGIDVGAVVGVETLRSLRTAARSG